jgi:hypothetical protein
MTFLRKLAISVKEAGRLGEAFCASALYEHCEEHIIDIPGLTQAYAKSGPIRIGNLMGKIFQNGGKVTLDGFLIERTMRTNYNADRQENKLQKVYIFTREDVPYIQSTLPPSPTYPTYPY